MINTFLTIIIPCINDVLGVKRTIENLSRKTKISGTRILVLDFGSTDGSIQYVAQASSEMLPSLRIESIKISEEESFSDAIKSVDTEYALVISTGSIFNDNDVILKSVNAILTNNRYPIVYLKTSENFLNNIISRYINKDRRNGAIFCKTESAKNIEFTYKDSNPEINLKKQFLSNGIKIGGFTDN